MRDPAAEEKLPIEQSFTPCAASSALSCPFAVGPVWVSPMGLGVWVARRSRGQGGAVLAQISGYPNALTFWASKLPEISHF